MDLGELGMQESGIIISKYHLLAAFCSKPF